MFRDHKSRVVMNPNHASHPHTYPRKLLLAVTGLSPQILTETLYALAVSGTPPFVPDEVHLITTSDGAEYARHTLLPGGMNRFAELLDDYGLNGRVRFDASHIHTIPDTDGNPLRDIQTPEDNVRAADAITELVRRFTQDEQCALHVSIAGGRKSMGFFMGYALSLYGRAQDRLSHVLVSAPFESNHDFYYPPATPRVLFDRNNKPIHTADARITLAEIPFVRLRHGLSRQLLEGQAGFSQTVQEAQERLGPPEVVIDIGQKALRCGGRVVKMEPSVFAFYVWLAQRLKGGAGAVRYDNPEDAEDFLAIYAQVLNDPSSARLENTRNALERRAGARASARKTKIRGYFDPLKSKANKALMRCLGHDAAVYLVYSHGERDKTHFNLSELDPALIRIHSQ